MTDLWIFSFLEKQIGGEIKDKEDEEDELIGGLSISQFFCKIDKPSSDSKKYPFFEQFVVPHGLVYLPECESYREFDKENKDDEEHSMCKNFDKLFFLAATNLGKSRPSKTRKKILR